MDSGSAVCGCDSALRVHLPALAGGAMGCDKSFEERKTAGAGAVASRGLALFTAINARQPGISGRAVARAPASLPELVLRSELVDNGLLLLSEAGAPEVASNELGFPGREGGTVRLLGTTHQPSPVPTAGWTGPGGMM